MKHTHLGVYAWITTANHVLLVHKGRGPYTGMWDLPGGKIEFGEEPLAALRREVAEETGLNIDAADLLTVLSHRIGYATARGNEDLHHLGIVYVVRLTAEPHVRAEPDGEDSLGAKWFAITDLSTLTLSPFAHRALTQILGQNHHE